MAKTLTTERFTCALSVIGPLTTTFTPPPSCFSTLYAGQWGLQLGRLDATSCYPPGFAADYQTVRSSLAYYSPGVCLSGYYPATEISSWLLGPSETGMHCCPRYDLPCPAQRCYNITTATTDTSPRLPCTPQSRAARASSRSRRRCSR